MGRVLAAALAFALVAACAAEAPMPTPSPATPAAPAPTPSPALEPPTPPGEDPIPHAIERLTIRTPEGNDTVFVPDEVSVGDGARVMLTYENASTAPHNLTFRPPIDARTQPFVESGQSDVVEFTAPAAGQYEFYCTLHPWMTGALIVE